MGSLSQKHGIKRAADWVVPATWNQGRVGTV